MTRRPAVRELLDWLEGRLSTADAARVRAAVDRDADAHETAEWLRRFLAVTADVVIADPPPRVHHALLDLFGPHVAKRRPTLVQRAVAVMQFDSCAPQALAGARGANTDDARQLAFAGEGIDVVIDVTGTGRRRQVSGQVFIDDDDLPEIDEAVLRAGDRVLAQDEPDELGEFEFRHVPAERVEIMLTGGDRELVVPLDLRPTSEEPTTS